MTQDGSAPMGAPLLAALVALAVAAGCETGPPFKGYEGPDDPPDDQVAILDWDAISPQVTEIDGKKVDVHAFLITGYSPLTQARLLPGEHTIKVSSFCHRCRPRRHVKLRLVVHLQPGHAYRVFTEEARRYVRVFIEDAQTGEVVLPPQEDDED